MSEKEIVAQKKRIEDYKAADDRDEADVRKQEEVLAEYVSGVADETGRLGKFVEELELVLVRLPPRSLHARAARAAANPSRRWRRRRSNRRRTRTSRRRRSTRRRRSSSRRGWQPSRSTRAGRAPSLMARQRAARASTHAAHRAETCAPAARPQATDAARRESRVNCARLVARASTQSCDAFVQSAKVSSKSRIRSILYRRQAVACACEKTPDTARGPRLAQLAPARAWSSVAVDDDVASSAQAAGRPNTRPAHFPSFRADHSPRLRREAHRLEPLLQDARGQRGLLRRCSARSACAATRRPRARRPPRPPPRDSRRARPPPPWPGLP